MHGKSFGLLGEAATSLKIHGNRSEEAIALSGLGWPAHGLEDTLGITTDNHHCKDCALASNQFTRWEQSSA